MVPSIISKNIQADVLQWAEEILNFCKDKLEASITRIHQISLKYESQQQKKSPFEIHLGTSFWLLLGMTCVSLSAQYVWRFLRSLIESHLLQSSVISDGDRINYNVEYATINGREQALGEQYEIPVATKTIPDEDQDKVQSQIHDDRFRLKKSISVVKEQSENRIHVNIWSKENLIGKNRFSTSAIRKDILIVLDLDGTLVHSHPIQDENYCETGIACPLYSQRGKLCTHHRPRLHYFVRKLHYYYTVAVWSTASCTYVNWIVDEIMPVEIYWHKVFCKNHLNYVKPHENQPAVAIKDLEKLEWETKNIICIDDRAHTYKFCEENLLWIRRWKGEDEEITNGLLFLLRILRFLFEEWPENVTEGIRIIAGEFPLKL